MVKVCMCFKKTPFSFIINCWRNYSNISWCCFGFKKKKSKQKAWLFIGDMTSQMGLFHEAYKYSRNFNLPLEIVIEDNGKSVKTDTKKVWNLKKINFPKDLFYYKYKLAYPPFGTGKWVTFK